MAESGEFDTLVRGFSCPHEGLDETLIEFIASEHANRCLDEFRDRFGPALTGAGDGLIEALTPEDDFPFDALWDSAFGACKRAVVEGRDQLAVPAATAAALRLVECGRSGDWSAQLPVAATLHFADYELPDVRKIRVSAAGERCRVTLDGRRTILFRRSGDTWGCRPDTLPRTLRCASIRVVRPACAPDIDLAAFGDPLTPATDVDAHTFAVAGREALQIMEAHAPQYAVWVRQLLRKVLPIAPTPGQLKSGGDNYQWGLIYSSAVGDVLDIAETMVHEITHQYLFLATRLGSIDDGTETRLFYSPVRDMPRPLDYIVIAYHAFANVFLFYQELERAGVEADRSRDQQAVLLPQLRKLAEAFDATSALTPVGLALCEPLRRRLEDAG